MFLKVLLIYLLFLYTMTFSVVLKPQEILDIVKLCAKRNNVTEAEYDKPELFLLRTPTENQMCMVKCVMELMEMMDFDGNLQKGVIRHYLSPFNRRIQEEIIVCAEKITRVSVCSDLEVYRKCLEPHFFND
ncbi:hypothetical protein Zmor_018523 [Zophobas morio]|uniref:Uncharacterized protein n=1 Tax=Zophobas morio TaxID=2755281 RepID=A0AA38IE39_9CUCU|nr:hypothetical protein Zmor_018523 [Zophobas morio]